MSALNIPQQPGQSSTNALASHDLAPMSHSRRGSAADTTVPQLPQTASPGAPGSASAKAGLVPLPAGPMQSQAETYALTSPVDWKETDHLATTADNVPTTTFYIGKDRKAFHLPTAALKEKSPFLKNLLARDNGMAGTIATPDQTSFDDFDEFGTRLFMHWINSGGQLRGPHDFHSLAHYLSLYAMALKFEMEELQNQVMDSVRHYYRSQNMTAPAYRLEYIYTYTHTPNKMRAFLVSTATFRALEDSHAGDQLHRASSVLVKSFASSGNYLSDSVKGALARNPEMAIDFIETLVKLHRCGEHDARHGSDCDWHVHTATPKCKVENPEPWQTDGAADPKPAEPKKDDTKPAAPGGPVAPTTPTKPADKKADPAKPSEERKSAPTTAEKPLPASPWRSETQRLQWEMTERALAKNDKSPLKSFGQKMKEKLHSKKDKSPEKPKDDKKDDKLKDDKPKDDKKDAAKK